MTGIPTNLTLVAATIAGLLLVLHSTRTAARSLGTSAELQRKIVHVATGGCALVLPLVFHERWPIVVLTAVSLVVLLVLRLPVFSKGGLSSSLHGVGRRSFGEIYLVIAVGFLFQRSIGQPVLYVLPILVLTLSDAAAALVGSSYGREKFVVEDGSKSLEGVAVFFVVTWLVSMIALLLMTDAPRLTVIVLSFFIAVLGALVEADSWKGLDNLFIPVVVHVMLVTQLDMPPDHLFVEATFYTAFLGFLIWAAPKVGVTYHSARAGAALLLTMFLSTWWFNAVIPALLVIAHVMLTRTRPCRARWPDLDLVAMLAAVSIFWLFAEDATGVRAVGCYSTTMAGFLVAVTALSFRETSPPASLAMPAVAMPLLLQVHDANVDLPASFGDGWWWMAAGLAVPALLPVFAPRMLDRWRYPRIAATAALVPAAWYASAVLSG